MFCRKCGSKIDPDGKFCTSCGEAIVDIRQNEVSEIIETKKEAAVLSPNLQPTTQGKRILNYIIDIIGIFAGALLLGIALYMLGLGFLIEETDDTIFGWLIMFVYYLLFEAVWGKSPAKFITKTKVITENGNKPDFRDIFVRTLCRFIPFEQFSFFSSNPIGLHDRFSKTLVVDDK